MTNMRLSGVPMMPRDPRIDVVSLLIAMATIALAALLGSLLFSAL
jgi:hypothetical protein